MHYVSSTVDGPCHQLSAIAVFENNKRVPLSVKEVWGIRKYPYYGATGQMDSVGGFLSTESACSLEKTAAWFGLM
jgi:hypothetical protein